MKKKVQISYLRVIKRFLFIASGLLLVTSVVFGIVVLSKCNDLSCATLCDCLGKAGSIFATISIGLIPLIVSINGKIENEIELKREDQENTAFDLHDFTDLLSNDRTVFVTNTLGQFKDIYNLDRFRKDFFSNNKATICNDMENAIIATDVNWPKRLLDAIKSNLYYLKVDDQITKTQNDSHMIDLFIEYLYFILDKLEIYAYNFINIRTLPGTYKREIAPFVKDIYFWSYFILVKTHNNNNFPSIDVACDIINIEEEI